MKKNNSLIMFLCILFLCSCKKNHDAVVNSNPAIDVYVAGYEFNGTYNVAKYWKNGSPVSLTDGSKDAQALSIAVSGNDVYVAGYEVDPITINYAAKLWKNGDPVTLIEGSPYAEAHSVTVLGADVYVAGDEEDNQYSGVAKYWKNGVPVIIKPALGFSLAYANSIAVSGADVYVAGGSNDGNEGMAEYWKNGTSVILNDPAEYFGRATSIAVVGNDVYVAGNLDDYRGNRTAKIWKNGNPVQLGTNDVSANAIAVSGNDVYVAGTESNGTHYIAKYWKNDKPVNLTDGSKDAIAHSIFLVSH
jgi:hypothetical protein